MVSCCSAIGCSYRHTKGSKVGLYRFPKDKLRLKMWTIAMCRRIALNWEPNHNSRVCGKHFQTGKPNADPNHPDFVPTIFKSAKMKKSNAILYEARMKCIEQEKHMDVESMDPDNFEDDSEEEQEYVDLQVPAVDESRTRRPVVVELSKAIVKDDGNIEKSPVSNFNEEEGMNEEIITPVPDTEVSEEHQNIESLTKSNTELKAIVMLQEYELTTLKSKIEEYKEMVSSRDKEIYALRDDIEALRKKTIPFVERVFQSDTEFAFYTGLRSKEAFHWLKQKMKDDFLEYTSNLSDDNTLLLILIKLKLNLTFCELCSKFDTSGRTVGRVLDIWIPKMTQRIKVLVRWPSKENSQENLPTCFENSIYRDTVAIIDFIEIPIQKPRDPNAKDQTWSRSKRHHFVKFLISVTPSGHVSFVSPVYGANTSTEDIISQSHFLDKIHPGDIILANEEFQLTDCLAEAGARLLVPGSVQEGEQPSSLEDIRNDYDVQSHVEHVVQRIKYFKIFKSVIPVTFLRHLDNAIVLCAALYNLSNAMDF